MKSLKAEHWCYFNFKHHIFISLEEETLSRMLTKHLLVPSRTVPSSCHPTDSQLWEIIYSKLAAQTLFAGLSRAVSGLSREHRLKHRGSIPIPACATGIWRPVCNPALPVPAACSNERVETGGVCLRGSDLVTITVVILMPLNLAALLTWRGSVTWVAVPKNCFWMSRWMQGVRLKVALLGHSHLIP